MRRMIAACLFLFLSSGANAGLITVSESLPGCDQLGDFAQGSPRLFAAGGDRVTMEHYHVTPPGQAFRGCRNYVSYTLSQSQKDEYARQADQDRFFAQVFNLLGLASNALPPVVGIWLGAYFDFASDQMDESADRKEALADDPPRDDYDQVFAYSGAPVAEDWGVVTGAYLNELLTTHATLNEALAGTLISAERFQGTWFTGAYGEYGLDQFDLYQQFEADAELLRVTLGELIFGLPDLLAFEGIDDFSVTGLDMTTYEALRGIGAEMGAQISAFDPTDFSTPGGPPPNKVPEPGTIGLLGIGLASLVLARRRRNAWSEKDRVLGSGTGQSDRGF